jgi:Subtilase family
MRVIVNAAVLATTIAFLSACNVGQSTVSAQVPATAASATTPGPEAIYSLAVRPTSDPQENSRIWHQVAAAVPPVKYAVARPMTPSELLDEVCGPVAVKADWIARVQQLNKLVSTNSIAQGRTLDLPPCPFWTGPVAVTIPAGGSVSVVAQSHMGTSGPRTLQAIAIANGTTAAGLQDVKAGTSLMLPYSLVRRSVWVPARVNAIESLASTLPPAANVEQTQELNLVSAVANTQECVGPQAGEPWPFDHIAVVDVLRRNRTFRRARRTLRETIVGIIDTGIARDESRLPLAINGIEDNGVPDHDDEPNGFIDDVVGVNLDHSKGFPAAQPGYSDHSHGTHVAGLAAGGLAAADLSAVVTPAISVRILNLVKPRGLPPNITFELPTAGISEAVAYASRETPIPVLNFSVWTRFDLLGVRQAFESLRDQVAVVAAGNAGDDLDGTPWYPASYAKTQSRVIAVGSHDGRAVGQRLSSFSNYGPRTVDLLAPGCKVRSAVPGGWLEMSGTSQAAPLVSFTAALLYSEGVPAYAIRNRLLATVDLDPSLLNTVKSSGRLNIANAISVYEDIVVLRNGQTLRGKIVDASVPLSNRPVPVPQIARVSFDFAAGSINPDWVYLRRVDGTMDAEFKNVRRTDTIQFQAAGSVRQLTVAEIGDLIMAYYRP